MLCLIVGILRGRQTNSYVNLCVKVYPGFLLERICRGAKDNMPFFLNSRQLFLSFFHFFFENFRGCNNVSGKGKSFRGGRPCPVSQKARYLEAQQNLCRYQFDRLPPPPPGHPGAFAPKCVPSPGAFAQQKMPGGRANKG